MTIPKKIIELAIEGGYDPSWNIQAVDEFPELYDRACLDPLFWQALGKKLGWGTYEEGWKDSSQGIMIIGEVWIRNAHNFYDLILVGGGDKSLDEFWEEMLSSK